MLATAESLSGRSGPIFLQNVFFICIEKPPKKVGWFFWGFTPSKGHFFWTRWLAGQISKNEGRPSILENCIIRKYRLSLVGELGWPLFQNWGAPLNSGILQNMKSYSYFIHYDEQTVTDWKKGEWRFIEYLNGQLVRQYDAIIRNNENMIEWRKEQPAISTDCEDLVVNKAAIVSDEASHNDFWRGCRISVWWGGELGGGEGTAAPLPGCLPLHFGWSPTAETLSDTSLCMLQILQNLAARKSRGVLAWSLAQWTKFVRYINEGGLVPPKSVWCHYPH